MVRDARTVDQECRNDGLLDPGHSRQAGGRLGAALASIVLIGAIDHASGIEMRTFPLYYGPISLLAWYRGRTAPVGLLIGVQRDRVHRERILSRVDPLTQLLNTRAFHEDAHRLVRRPKTSVKNPPTL
jgi:hypothetical protein